MTKLIPLLLLAVCAHSNPVTTPAPPPTSMGQFYLQAPAMVDEDWFEAQHCRNTGLDVYYFKDTTNFVIEERQQVNYFAINGSGQHSLEGLEDSDLLRLPLTAQSSDADALVLGKLLITAQKNTLMLMTLGMSMFLDGKGAWRLVKRMFSNDKRLMALTEERIIKDLKNPKRNTSETEEMAGVRFEVVSFQNSTLKLKMTAKGVSNSLPDLSCKPVN